MVEMKEALSGIKVVEVGNILAGPVCGTLMADFGADVVKVEPPQKGDLIRNMGRIKDMWYSVEARNKRSVTLNLKDERGKEILTDLIKGADILIQNFRPGAFERLGFTWEKIQEINPKVVYVCASGYGQTGPSSHKPGFDRIGLALGGFLHVTGFEDGPPIKPGISVADFMTAMLGCIGAMFALYSRDVIGTGKGQMVDCCLTETTLRFAESIIAEYSYDKSIRKRMGNATQVTIPAGHFLTKDDEYLVVSVAGDKVFSEFAKSIEREDMLKNQNYNNGASRLANADEINGICECWVRNHTIAECLEAFGDRIPNCKVYTVEDILKDEHFKFRNAIVDVETEKFGTIKMQNVTPKMSGTPGKIKWAGPALGNSNEEVYLNELNIPVETYETLKTEGVI